MFNVMVVDDDSNVREGLKLVVPWEEYGFIIAEAACDGEEALQKYKRQSFDLIVVDMRLPKANGLELISSIRKMDSRVHFLVLSGYADFEYAKRSIDCRVDGYILKPVDEEELIEYLIKIGEALKKERQREWLDGEQDFAVILEEGSNEILIKKMLAFIEENYSDKLTLEMCAGKFNYGSGYLGRLFKKHMGESFNTYLDRVRIQKAKDLLLRGMKVYQVAELTGYSNVDYFNLKFRKYLGISPSQFRKRKDL